MIYLTIYDKSNYKLQKHIQYITLSILQLYREANLLFILIFFCYHMGILNIEIFTIQKYELIKADCI